MENTTQNITELEPGQNHQTNGTLLKLSVAVCSGLMVMLIGAGVYYLTEHDL